MDLVKALEGFDVTVICSTNGIEMLPIIILFIYANQKIYLTIV